MVLMVGAAGRGTGVNVTYLVPFFMERFGVNASTGGFPPDLDARRRLVGPLAIAWFSDRCGKRHLVTQGTLFLSALLTCLVGTTESFRAAVLSQFILYGAFVQARGALTQAMIGDFATAEPTDAAFSIYYFVGFISGPIWTLIIGYLMEHYGSRLAFYVAAPPTSLGMLLLLFVKNDQRDLRTTEKTAEPARARIQVKKVNGIKKTI